MPKKNKRIRAKLLANPGVGDIVEAASRIEQARQYLCEKRVEHDESES